MWPVVHHSTNSVRSLLRKEIPKVFGTILRCANEAKVGHSMPGAQFSIQGDLFEMLCMQQYWCWTKSIEPDTETNSVSSAEHQTSNISVWPLKLDKKKGEESGSAKGSKRMHHLNVHVWAFAQWMARIHNKFISNYTYKLVYTNWMVWLATLLADGNGNNNGPAIMFIS